MWNKALIFVLPILYTCSQVVAQGVFVPQSFSTPGGKITTYNYIHIPAGNNISNLKSPSRIYSITLSNDSIIKVKARINFLKKKHTIEISKNDVNGGRSFYYPAQTKSLVAYDNKTKQPINGIPSDSVWLFKFKEGKITMYSFLPEMDENAVIAYRYNSDTIKIINKENLLIDLRNCPEALRYVEKKKFLKAINLFNEL